ncbi:MAG: type II toxin-antitoxin system RelE/ParE family toxin [Leucobacter sp.]|nr:type II toxin-antitoxin system RelE/ParE family toxin [Leucobacter sp.]
MSTYRLAYTRDFEKALRRLDRPVQRRVLAALVALTELEDPTAKLKPPRGSKVGLWRLRIGDYRAIVEVRRNELTIVALDTDHRSRIYEE